jgi:uncharacterized protein (TIGR00730 family)
MNICVYCGSLSGSDPAYTRAANHVASEMVRRGLGLVYGGGGIGIMGTIASAIREQNGHVHGIIPTFLAVDEVLYSNCSELTIVESMHRRKQLMIDHSSMLLALPGGYGTLDELFEAITWKQLQLHDRPIGLLNINGYFDPLLALIEHMSDKGFVRDKHKSMMIVSDSVTELLDQLVEQAGNPLYDRTERG